MLIEDVCCLFKMESFDLSNLSKYFPQIERLKK